MLGPVRRYGVAQALRVSVPRSLYVRSAIQLPKWKPASILRLSNGIRPLHNIPPARSSASAAVQEDGPAQSESEPLSEFSDLGRHGLVDPKIIDNITNKMKITTMTEVQSKTLYQTLRGDDTLAQAKTGTGKTLAFLVPVLQNLMQSPRPRRSNSVTEIRALIISPTRELAEQIAVQARILASGTGLKVQTAVGGTGKLEGLRRIRREGCDILVGTPGRLQDVLSDPGARIGTSTLSSLVLDEADRLLDDGFAPELMRIQDLLPDPMKVDRQTLMFSATVAKEVMHMVRRTMKPGFNFIKTVRNDEAPVHLSVPQKNVVLNGMENALPAVLEIAKNYQAKMKEDPGLRPFKAIVYFNTTAEVALAYEVARRLDMERSSERFLGQTSFFQMHSRLTQAQRTRSADAFRRLRSAILLSSDVTARGMDFPDVTHVIQVGKPKDRDSYIHRLGRTARANKTGEGWVLLHRGEIPGFDDLLGDMPIEEDNTSLTTAGIDMSKDSPSSSPVATEIIDKVNAIMPDVDYATKKSAYMAMLSLGAGQSRRRYIQTLNNLATNGYLLEEPPAVPPLVARKMGLDGVPGIKISSHVPYEDMVGGDRKMSRGGFGSDRRRDNFNSRPRSLFEEDNFNSRPRSLFEEERPRSMFSNDRNDQRRRRDSFSVDRPRRPMFSNDRNDRNHSRRRRDGLF